MINNLLLPIRHGVCHPAPLLQILTENLTNDFRGRETPGLPLFLLRHPGLPFKIWENISVGRI